MDIERRRVLKISLGGFLLFLRGKVFLSLNSNKEEVGNILESNNGFQIGKIPFETENTRKGKTNINIEKMPTKKGYRLKFKVSGEELGQVHNDMYTRFNDNIEKELTNGSFVVTNFKKDIGPDNTIYYTMEYRKTIEGDVADKHCALQTTVYKINNNNLTEEELRKKIIEVHKEKGWAYDGKEVEGRFMNILNLENYEVRVFHTGVIIYIDKKTGKIFLHTGNVIFYR